MSEPHQSHSADFPIKVLFLDRELAETLDPQNDQNSSVRSQLRDVLLDRMSRASQPSPRPPTADKSPSLPPVLGSSNEVSKSRVPSFTTGPPQLPSIASVSVNLSDSRTSTPPAVSGTLSPSPWTQSKQTGWLLASRKPSDSILQDTALTRQKLTSNPTPLPSPPPSSLDGVNKTHVSPQSTPPSRVSLDSTRPEQNSQIQSRYNSSAPTTSRPAAGHSGSISNHNVRLPPAEAHTSLSHPPPTPATHLEDRLPNPLSRTNTMLTSPFSDTDHDVSLKSPFSEAGHDEHSPSERASVLTSPHSPITVPELPSPWASRRSVSTASDQKKSISSAHPKVEESNNFLNEAGAWYYIQQIEADNSQNQNPPRRVPTTIAEQDDDEADETSTSRQSSFGVMNPKSESHVANSPVLQDAPMTLQENSLSQANPNKPAVNDRFSQVGRKPSGARAPTTTTRSHIADGISSSQQVTEEESQSEDKHESSQNSMELSQVVTPATSEDSNADVLAVLSYLDTEDKPSSLQAAKVEPLNIRSGATKPPSPPPLAPPPAEATQYKSSFAPSKQAAERKAKVQAQQAAHHAAVLKPGRANGRKSKIAGAWDESSEDEDDEEDDDDDDDDGDGPVDSDAERDPGHSKNSGFGSSNASLRQHQNREQGLEEADMQYPHLRPPRTLPQVPGGPNYRELGVNL